MNQHTKTQCTHENTTPWDCGCTFGPPSCTSCHIRRQCNDCGRLLDDSKPIKVTCKICNLTFPSKTSYQKHKKRAAHRAARDVLRATVSQEEVDHACIPIIHS